MKVDFTLQHSTGNNITGSDIDWAKGLYESLRCILVLFLSYIGHSGGLCPRLEGNFYDIRVGIDALAKGVGNVLL
jgi:hypothetical protein